MEYQDYIKYDDWANTCKECGAPIHPEKSFCSKICLINYNK